jgi:hypothetical protein
MIKVRSARFPAWLRATLSILAALACMFGGWGAANAFDQGIPPSEGNPQVVPTPTGPGSSPSQAPASSLRYLSVAGAVFLPANSGYSYQYCNSGCIRANSSGYWRAPVNLPDGSVIKSIRISYYNGSDSLATTAWLTRYKVDGDYLDMIAVNSRAASTTGIGYFSDTSGELTTDNIIDNLNYVYTFIWSGFTVHDPPLTRVQRLCSVRVAYIPPSVFGVALPLITR